MKKILIVDDQPETVRLLEIILRREDRELLSASNGRGALELARQADPDLMLLDIMMPGELDGYQVARALKDDPRTRHIHIIVMTAKAQKQDRLDALGAGADDYIAKPFDVMELRTRVETSLA